MGTDDGQPETELEAAFAVRDFDRVTPGATLLAGRFRIQRRLGAGGMGIVYEAHDAVRRGPVALKLIASLDAAGIYRLKNEFRALADVVHPGLVRLHELFCDGAQWFFSMDLIEGVPFDRWVRPLGTIDLDEARLRSAMSQCLTAVRALHAAGKLHRDLKPSNVLVTSEGRVVVLDFGLSADPELGGQGQTTLDGSVSGTPAYMAPEQAAGEHATAASDFYALGVMMFEALTGRWPFEGPSGAMIAAKQRDAAPTVSSLVTGERSVPRDLELLCAELLEREPSKRPTTSAMYAALGDTEPAVVSPETSSSRPPRNRRSSVPPSGAGKDSELLGRETELAFLERAYAHSIDSRPQVVVVSGESGIGKSALIDAFLARLRAQGMACTLAARCNERESLPFKAFDGVVDGLSRYMRRLSRDAAALLPRDVFALAKIFPVLDRMEVIAEAPKRLLGSDDELRPRAFAAFAELLGRIRDREPVVVAIDDAQWVDRDSIALLSVLLQQPEPTPLLLVLAHRSEREAAALAETTLLHELLDAVRGETRWQVEDLVLEPLPFEPSTQLARRLLGEDSDLALAQSIAGEAHGSPFFVGELSSLARSSQARDAQADRPSGEHVGTRAAAPTLAEAIERRIARLPETARVLLEVLAVAGRPLANDTALSVAGAGHDAIDCLRGERLARSATVSSAVSSASRAEPQAISALECYHDRIREAVSAALSAETVQQMHAKIARVLAAEPHPDLEHLAAHFEGALEPVQASQYAAAAAERAADKLAFDRAAELYRRALELGSFDVERTRKLTLARGQALANAGRTDAAAKIYLDALPGASEHEAPRLRGRAAEQLMLGAQVDRVIEQLDALLASQGLPALNLARSPIPALLFRRAALHLRGFSYQLRADTEIDPKTLRLLEVYWSCVMGLAQIDLIRSAEFSARHLWLALSAGSATHIGRALAYESSIAGGTGGRQDYARAADVLARASQLAERTNDPYLHACVAQWSGVNALNAGRYADAVADSERAIAIYRTHAPVLSWEVMTAEMFLLWALWGQGRFAQLSDWLRTHIEREESGNARDLPAVMKTFFALVYLVRDDVSIARQIAEVSVKPGADQRPYSFPDFMRWCVECMIDWYSDDNEAAWRKCDVAWSRMRHAPMMRNVSTRISVLYSRAGSALLAMRVTPAGSRQHAALMRAATLTQRELAKGSNVVGQAWACVIAAGLACARGERAEAIEETRVALAHFEAQGAGMYAAAARRRLGVLLSNVEGAALVAQADREMAEQGIVRPDRITAMLVPACEILRSSVADALRGI